MLKLLIRKICEYGVKLQSSTIDSYPENIRHTVAMQNRTKRCKDPQIKSKNPKIPQVANGESHLVIINPPKPLRIEGIPIILLPHIIKSSKENKVLLSMPETPS